MAKRKGTTTKKRLTTKKKLVGFTKKGKKYALVYKKGKTLSVGKSLYASKKTLLAKAKTLLGRK